METKRSMKQKVIIIIIIIGLSSFIMGAMQHEIYLAKYAQRNLSLSLEQEELSDCKFSLIKQEVEAQGNYCLEGEQFIEEKEVVLTKEQELLIITREFANNHSYNPMNYNCVIYSRDLSNLLREKGYKTYIIEGSANTRWFEVMRHQWVLVCLEGQSCVHIEPQTGMIVYDPYENYIWFATKGEGERE